MLRDKALKANPIAGITFDNVAVAAMRDDADGQGLRATIARLADQQAEWFRSAQPHTRASDRVIQTRASEVRTLNSMNTALLAAMEFGKSAAAGDQPALISLREELQASVRAIDEMAGSTTERRALLRSLSEDCAEASGDVSFVEEQLAVVQQAYLTQMMEERLSRYDGPPKEPSEGFDFNP